MRSKSFGMLLAIGFAVGMVRAASAQVHPLSAIDSTTAKHDSTMAAPAAPAPAAQPAAQPPPPAAAPAAAAAPPPASKSAPNNRIYYGGTVSLSFGSTTSFGIYPMLGYKLTPKISGGVEAGYEYVNYSSGQTSNNYGGSVFGRYRVGRNLYAHAEYQSINYEIFSTRNSSTREWVPALLLGGGYVKGLNARTSLYAEVLFDVLNDKNSPYKSGEPRVNFGVAVGF
jgi:hypothetical protein